MNRDPVENTIASVLDDLYLHGENRQEVNFWAPLAHLTTECLESRDAEGISQSELAERMKTTQSVISRFENMGGSRLPSYGFIARLSQAFGHEAGMTLYGDFMAVVPSKRQAFITQIAKQRNLPARVLVEQLLEQAINWLEVSPQFSRNMELSTNSYYATQGASTSVLSSKGQSVGNLSGRTGASHILPWPGAA